MAVRDGDEEFFNRLSGFRALWLFAMFDLPTKTKKDRREYTQFRKALLNDGFVMMQFSIYARYCRDESTSTWYRESVKLSLPPRGHVRLLAVTDKQFGMMDNFIGKDAEEPEEPPKQMMLF